MRNEAFPPDSEIISKLKEYGIVVELSQNSGGRLNTDLFYAYNTTIQLGDSRTFFIVASCPKKRLGVGWHIFLKPYFAYIALLDKNRKIDTIFHFEYGMSKRLYNILRSRYDRKRLG